MAVRRSREELKKLVVEAGVEVLLDSQVNLSIDALGYQSVFDHLVDTQGIRVTHASVHERIWPSQRHFQLAVLAAAVESIPEITFDVFASAAEYVLTDAALEDPDARRRAAREIVRLAINDSFEHQPETYKLLATLRYLCASYEPDDDVVAPLRDVVAKSRARTSVLYTQLVQELMAVLRLRPRAALGLGVDEAARVLAHGSNVAVTGYDVDDAVIDVPMIELPTGRDGEMQLWHPVAVTTWALVRTLLELDGDVEGDRTL